ncbi:MAG: AAA family ATPase, partial [Treponema sp.]|nr:AAA family ATPase [Treponema sp.]
VFPAKIIIEQDRIYAENWNKSLKPGRITPEEFTPYPKNPLLARFFVNIGLADQLGSGIRNLYRYTRLYSGTEPELLEGDIFKTIIYLAENSVPKAGDKVSDKVSDKTGRTAEDLFLKSIMPYIEKNGTITSQKAAEITGKAAVSTRRYLKKLVDAGMLTSTGANRNKTYQR